jgi:outer membrane lipoprotein-sorting protein
MKMKTGLLTCVLCLSAATLRSAEPGETARLDSSDEIVNQMLKMNSERANALSMYTSQRRYTVENPRFSQHAEMTVREKYAYPDKREFQITAETGSTLIRRRVIDKLMEAETDSMKSENRSQTYISRENYSFELKGTDSLDGRTCYLLDVTPKARKKYLMRGRIWVDTQEFAIVRMEGSPAQNPSIWTKKVHFVRQYEKQGDFWLPALIQSNSDVLIAGKSSLTITYSGYQINKGSAGAEATAIQQ